MKTEVFGPQCSILKLLSQYSTSEQCCNVCVKNIYTCHLHLQSRNRHLQKTKLRRR